MLNSRGTRCNTQLRYASFNCLLAMYTTCAHRPHLLGDSFQPKLSKALRITAAATDQHQHQPQLQVLAPIRPRVQHRAGHDSLPTTALLQGPSCCCRHCPAAAGAAVEAAITCPARWAALQQPHQQQCQGGPRQDLCHLLHASWGNNNTSSRQHSAVSRKYLLLQAGSRHTNNLHFLPQHSTPPLAGLLLPQTLVGAGLGAAQPALFF